MPKWPKTQLIACGMLAREVLDLIEINGWEHVELKCLPAELHYYPERIPSAVEEAVAAARADGFEHISIGYADCGTGGELDRTCEKLGVERLQGPHCFALYLGLHAFENKTDEYITTFFITDFLARHPDTFFFKPLGLDRYPELTETYFGNYQRALYISQTEDETLLQSAKTIAQHIGLAFQHHHIGYGDLGQELALNSARHQSL